METLTGLYDRLVRIGCTNGFERVVLDDEFRSLLFTEAVLERLESSPELGRATLRTVYTWAAEAGCEGDTESAGVMARWFLVQNCVRRPRGITSLISAHRRAVEEHGDERAGHLRGALPAVVELLAEEDRTEEISALLAHLERLGERPLLGLCLLRTGNSGQDVAGRYVSVEAAELGADVDAIYGDTRLRYRLLVLARVCDAFFAEHGPRELDEFREVFRRRPRSFKALYWGDECTGALIEDGLRLRLPGMRLHLEACRERWYLDGVVRRIREAERPGFAHTLVLSAALRSNQVARWLAEEPSTGQGEGADFRVRRALFRARVPRRSLYAELLSQACAPNGAGLRGDFRAVRSAVRDHPLVLWRSAVFWVVLLGAVMVDGYLGLSWWWGVALSVVIGLALPVRFNRWWNTRAWFQLVLLPPRKGRLERRRLLYLAGGLVLYERRLFFSPLYPEAYVRRHMTPVWEAIAFRETVQADPGLASKLALRLGRHSVHTADDVSVLLARYLPWKPS